MTKVSNEKIVHSLDELKRNEKKFIETVVHSIHEVENASSVKKLLRGFENFSLATSFHGYAELYNTKSFFWKIFWIILCSSASLVTTYQVCESIRIFFEQPTNTVVTALKPNEMFYPPLHLCYWQWFFWVDWMKVENLKYDKDALLYGLRYFNAIYTEQYFDVSEANQKFQKIMDDNNFTFLLQFYIHIARSVPIKSRELHSYFDEVKIMNKGNYSLFCYEISSKSFLKYFTKNIDFNNVISFEISGETHKDVSHMLSKHEYVQYMSRWIEKGSMYTFAADKWKSNLTNFAPPVTLLLLMNMEKGNEILYENDAYLIDVRVSVYNFLNKHGKNCQEHAKSISPNKSCGYKCWAVNERNSCNCQPLFYASDLNRDTVNNVCYKSINFINRENSSIHDKDINRIPNCTNHENSLLEHKKCVEACVPACQIWKYEKTIQIKSTSDILRQYGTKNSTRILIDYPIYKDIIVMTESNVQNWQAFVGNVGGILGIWTGASVVSFFQLVYLCCCADHEKFTDCLPFVVKSKRQPNINNLDEVAVQKG